jgi:hypothetical protein
LHEFLESLDLLRILFAGADDLLRGGLYIQRDALAPLAGNERGDAIQGHAAVIADDANAAVGIRQSGDQVAVPGVLDGQRVDVEDAVVVGLALLREDGVELR